MKRCVRPSVLGHQQRRHVPGVVAVRVEAAWVEVAAGGGEGASWGIGLAQPGRVDVESVEARGESPGEAGDHQHVTGPAQRHDAYFLSLDAPQGHLQRFPVASLGDVLGVRVMVVQLELPSWRGSVGRLFWRHWSPQLRRRS